MDNCRNSNTNTCVTAQLWGKVVCVSYRTNPGSAWTVVIHNNRVNCVTSIDGDTFKFLTYQLPMVGYRPTLAMTGNGEFGFDSREGA